MRLLAVCLACTIVACSTPEASPVSSRTDAVTPLTRVSTLEFDPDTRLPFAATTGQQLGARISVFGTSAVVAFHDGRQDPSFMKSVFTVRLEADGGRVTNTVLSVPSLAIEYSGQLDLTQTTQDTLMSFESGEIAQVKELGGLRGVHPTMTGHRLISAPNATFVLRANGDTVELTPTPDGGAQAPLASWSGLDTREFHLTGAASTTDVLVVFRSQNVDGGAPELHGALLSLVDGGLVPPFLISPSLGDQLTQPVAASDGTNFLVGWQRDRTGADGGVIQTVHFAGITASGVVGSTFAPVSTNPVDTPDLCFDGTAFRVLYRDVTDCCRARVIVATADPMTGALLSPSPLVDDWAVQPQLSCSTSAAAAVWTQWNYVNTGNGAVVMQWLRPDNTPLGATFPVSLTGEYQSVAGVTHDWLTFTTPRASFLTSTEGRPDASVALPGEAAIAGLPAHELGLLYGDITLERRSSASAVSGSQLLATPSPGYAERALAASGLAWEAAWVKDTAVNYVHADRNGITATELLSLGTPAANPSISANNASAVLVAWENQPQQVVTWQRVDGGTPQSLPGVYYSEPTVGGVRDRWLLAWNGNGGVGIVGTWVERDGRSDGGLVEFSTPGREASPRVACGPSECLLTWVRGGDSWNIMGRLIGSDGSMGTVFPILNGPDAELNPHPVFISAGVWLLGYDQFEPAIGTRRARLATLVAMPDGGMTVVDGGAGDAGTELDAGAAVDGGSEPDAGFAPDAGLVGDGGVEGDGGLDPSRRSAVVQCGCGGGGPAVLWLAVAALARRRRALSGRSRRA